MMEEKFIYDQTVFVKAGAIEALGLNIFNQWYQKYTTVTFEDGEVLHNVCVDSALVGQFGNCPEGTFYFIKMNKGWILLALDVEGGYRVNQLSNLKASGTVISLQSLPLLAIACLMLVTASVAGIFSLIIAAGFAIPGGYMLSAGVKSFAAQNTINEFKKHAHLGAPSLEVPADAVPATAQAA